MFSHMVLCIYTRSCNKNGIGTTHSSTGHTITQMHFLALQKFLSNCEIRGSKSEQMVVTGLLASIWQATSSPVQGNVMACYMVSSNKCVGSKEVVEKSGEAESR